MLPVNFVIIGVLIQLLGGIGYVRDTLKGKTKPNRVSWGIWCIAPFIAFFAQVQQGVGIQSLTTFIVGFIPLLVFTASFFNKNAVWKIGRLDIICGALSILGIILWAATREGNIAIFFGILADGLAFLPTIIKSFKYPETESANVYATGIINASITLLTVTHWNFETAGFAIYLLIADSIATYFILVKPGTKKAPKK